MLLSEHLFQIEFNSQLKKMRGVLYKSVPGNNNVG